jgi:hypothetical protein
LVEANGWFGADKDKRERERETETETEREREVYLELVVRASVKERGGHEVVAGLADGSHGDHLGGLPGRREHCSDAALQRCDALLKHVIGGVHHS